MACGRTFPIYDKTSGMLYVTTELDKTVSVIDPRTLKIVGAVPTGQEQSHMLVLSHDGKRGYTANVGPGTVSVLDMVGRKTVAVIPISGMTQRISISNDDKLVFTSDQTQPRLAVIDTATNKVKSWVELPGTGVWDGFDQGWAVAAGGDSCDRAGGRGGSGDAEGGADDCGAERSAGDSGAARWQGGLRLLQ